MEMKKAFIFLGGLIAGVVIKNKCEEYIKNSLKEKTFLEFLDKKSNYVLFSRFWAKKIF